MSCTWRDCKCRHCLPECASEETPSHEESDDDTTSREIARADALSHFFSGASVSLSLKPAVRAQLLPELLRSLEDDGAFAETATTEDLCDLNKALKRLLPLEDPTRYAVEAQIRHRLTETKAKRIEILREESENMIKQPIRCLVRDMQDCYSLSKLGFIKGRIRELSIFMELWYGESDLGRPSYCGRWGPTPVDKQFSRIISSIRDCANRLDAHLEYAKLIYAHEKVCRVISALRKYVNRFEANAERLILMIAPLEQEIDHLRAAAGEAGVDYSFLGTYEECDLTDEE